jgi:hypothetical protein
MTVSARAFYSRTRAPLVPQRDRRRLCRCALSACLCVASSLLTWAATPTNQRSAPFLRLRETTLGYHGPSDDSTDLTEIRIGWFGPTNLNDPLTGDLWWTANLAVQEANALTCAAGSGGALSAVSRISNPQSVGDFQPRQRVQPPAECNSAIQQTGSLRYENFARVPFRLIPRWAADPWGTGVSQLTRMVYEEQPLALLGSVDSASTHLAEQVVAKANLPLVSPIATDKSVTLAGVSWMFSCAPSDAAIAPVLVDAVLAAVENKSKTPQPGYSARSARGSDSKSPRMGAQDQSRLQSGAPPGWAFAWDVENPSQALALLTCTDHESRMTTREVMKEFSRRERLPDFRFDVLPGAPDLAKQISALAEARPAVVLIIAAPEDAARLVLALRAGTRQSPRVRQSSSAFAAAPETQTTAEDCGTLRRPPAEPAPSLSSCVVFGSHSMARTRFRELAGPAAEGVRFPLLFVPDLADATTARFIERFNQARGHSPDYASMLTYDATRLLIEAIRRAGPNRARIREMLTQLSPWHGIAGPVRFDGTGQNFRTNICMSTIRAGAVVLPE